MVVFFLFASDYLAFLPLIFFQSVRNARHRAVAIIAGLLMDLPFGLLMHLLPEKEHHGIGGALNQISQGIGAI